MQHQVAGKNVDVGLLIVHLGLENRVCRYCQLLCSIFPLHTLGGEQSAWINYCAALLPLAVSVLELHFRESAVLKRISKEGVTINMANAPKVCTRRRETVPSPSDDPALSDEKAQA